MEVPRLQLRRLGKQQREYILRELSQAQMKSANAPVSEPGANKKD